jgi:hypothetical protein
MIRVLTSMVPLLACFEGFMTNVESYHSCLVSTVVLIYHPTIWLIHIEDDCYIQPSILYKQDGWEPKGYVKTQSQPSVQAFAGWHPYTADLGLIGGQHHE